MTPYIYYPYSYYDRKHIAPPLAPMAPMPAIPMINPPVPMTTMPEQLIPAPMIPLPAVPMQPMAPKQPAAPNLPPALMQPVAPMQPAAPNLPPAPMQPVAPMQPAAPNLPPAPMQPVAPIQTMPPATPICPYTGLPINQGPGNAVMPAGMGNMGGMPNMGNMEGMEDMNFPASPAFRDPPPVLSNNPVTANISLFKELTGYPNYGNPSGNADILYTGTRGTWTFDIPPAISIGGNLRGQLLIRAVLDDHPNIPVSRYSARITVNGVVVHEGPLPLEHGFPAGTRFNNWRTLTFNIANLRRSVRVTIINTSTAGPNDWIGLDWMELRFVSR